MKNNPVVIYGAALFLSCIISLWVIFPGTDRQEKMVAVVYQINQATMEFVNAGDEMKKHPIHAVFYDDLAEALNAYNTRFKYIDAGGCPRDFKTAVANYKLSLAYLVQFHKTPQLGGINDAWQLLQNAATGMDSICRKYNIHFENINSFNVN
jgi:hypothetical protein